MAACAAVSAGNIRHILIANLGLGGEYADRGAGHVADHAVGLPDPFRRGCARVAAARADAGQAQRRGAFFNQAQLIGVQVESVHGAAVVHIDGGRERFPAGAGADVQHGHPAFGVQHTHSAAARDALHEEQTLVQQAQRLIRAGDDDGNTVAGKHARYALGGEAFHERIGAIRRVFTQSGRPSGSKKDAKISAHRSGYCSRMRSQRLSDSE